MRKVTSSTESAQNAPVKARRGIVFDRGVQPLATPSDPTCTEVWMEKISTSPGNVDTFFSRLTTLD